MSLFKFLEKQGSAVLPSLSSFLMLHDSNTETLQDPNLLNKDYIGLIILYWLWQESKLINFRNFTTGEEQGGCDI